MIENPDSHQLSEIGRISVISSVPGFMYRSFRDLEWVKHCGTHDSNEIFNKIVEVNNTIKNGDERMLSLALLVAFSFRKLSECESYLNQIDNNSDFWTKDIKERVKAQASKN